MAGIIPGQNASANEVMNALGSNFNDTAQNIFNADYIGFDSRLANTGTPSLKNVIYSTFTTDDAISSFGFSYDSVNDKYDLINGSTGVTETTPAQNNEDAQFTEMFCTANDDIIISSVFVNASTSVDVTIEIIQDSDIIATKTISTNSSQANEVSFSRGDYSRLISSGQAFSIKGTAPFLNGKDNISFSGSLFSFSNQNVPSKNSGDSGNMTITATQFIEEDQTLIIGDTSDIGEDITNIIAVINSSFVGGTPVLEFSNDNTNFEAITNTEIHRPTTTGQKRIIKITFSSVPTSGFVSEFAVKHNFY